jgi:hypothetical protein
MMMEIEKYVHSIGMLITIMINNWGYIIYRYFKKRKKGI